MSDQASFVGRLRRPEYTGENRCVPCTVVNVAIALVVSVAAGLLFTPLGVVVLGASLAAIYLRGYLVPGTPELTKRYLPESVLRQFDKGPSEDADLEFEDELDQVEDPGIDEDYEFETLEKIAHHEENEVDPEAFLLEVGATEPCEDVDDLCLTEEFREAFEAAIEPYRDGGVEVDRETYAAMFDAEPDEVEFPDRDYPAVVVRRRVRKWPSEAALATDVASHRALTELTDRWMDVPIEQRVEMLESLRAFHGACPFCGGRIALSEDTVESCCSAYQVRALGCVECGDPLIEFDPEMVEAGKGVRA